MQLKSPKQSKNASRRTFISREILRSTICYFSTHLLKLFKLLKLHRQNEMRNILHFTGTHDIYLLPDLKLENFHTNKDYDHSP